MTLCQAFVTLERFTCTLCQQKNDDNDDNDDNDENDENEENEENDENAQYGGRKREPKNEYINSGVFVPFGPNTGPDDVPDDAVVGKSFSRRRMASLV